MFKPTTFGKYYLTERLAVGGMAEIYKAKLIGVGGFERPMVVKQILPQLARNPSFVDMFIDEARIAVALTHGNIVQVYELGKMETTYFIAMEYVEGRDLADILDAAFQKEKFPGWELACFIAVEILHGLDYAHRRRDDGGKPLGIVHRDISPQNILVSFEGEVKITDFGIAKAVHKLAATQSGVIKGKFGYMSPEQAAGDDVDARTDIFSVGVLLYEMLTGRRLFHGRNDAESIEKVREAKVPTPSLMRSGVPAGLDPVVFKALARDRHERYPTSNAFQLDLSRFLFAHGTGSFPHRLAGYMRELFGERLPEPPVEAPPAVERPAPSPRPATSLTAQTDALIDDLIPGRRPGADPPDGSDEAPRVSTQILNAQTDALLGELGLSGEPTETPLPSARPPSNSGWSAVGRPIERSASDGRSTRPMYSADVGPAGRGPADAHEGGTEGALAVELAPSVMDEPRPSARPRRAHRPPVTGVPARPERPEQLLGIPGIADESDAHAMLRDAPSRGGSNALWIATVLTLLGVLAVVSWRTGLLSGHYRERKRADAEARLRQQATATAAAMPGGATGATAAPRYGTVEIGAATDGARVYMLLGRAPLDVPHLDMGVTQELRLDSDGFWSQPAVVSPQMWQSGDQARLTVAMLRKGGARPSAPKVPADETPAEKFGTLHIDSNPSGAQVWLLVGFTPQMHMEGLRADRDYRFLVVAEHHLPRTVDLPRAGWKDDGLRLTFRSDVELPEDPKDPIPVVHIKRKAKPKSQTLRF
jgi:serine/threonine protein kinase